MKKRMLSLLISALVLAQCLCFAAAEAADPMEEFIGQTSVMLDTYERIYAVRREAYAAIEAFCTEPSYSALVQARIACDQAAQSLYAIEIPMLTLSDEQLLEWMRMGIETDLLETQFAAIPGMIAYGIDDMQMFEMLLYITVFQVDQQSSLDGWLNVSQRALSCQMQIDCCLLNGLLQPVSDDAQAMNLWNSLPERCPTLGGETLAWTPDEETLLPIIENLYAEYEEIITQTASETLGRDAYFAYRYENIIAEGDWNAYQEGVASIPGLPTLAPLPTDWLNPAEAVFLSVSYRDAADVLPDSVVICDENVSREAFLNYAATLEACGAELYSEEVSEETGEKYIYLIDGQILILYRTPDAVAAVCYNPQKLSLEAAVCG